MIATVVACIGIGNELKDLAPATVGVQHGAREPEREPQGSLGAASARSLAASLNQTAVTRRTASRSCLDARAGRAYYLVLARRYASRLGVEFRPSHEHPRTCARARELAHIAKRKARRLRLAWVAHRNWFVRLYAKWRCIHEHEGAWNANTGNGYYGGLQMTLSFQAAHGPEYLRRWGTANNWPVWAQLEAAEDAWHDDGGSFREWGTAGMCGLA